MGIHVPSDDINKFIGKFIRMNAKTPSSRPDECYGDGLDRLVITKGMLQILVGGRQVEVVIPLDDQVDESTYAEFTEMLARDIANLLQVPHYTANIHDALNAHGLVAQFFGDQLQMNPLAGGFGEIEVVAG